MSESPPKKGVHSVKVPRLYKAAASILDSYKRGEDSVKNLVYRGQGKQRHPNVKALLALLMEAVNREQQIEAATQAVQLFTKEPRFSPSLASVLLAELVWGKGRLPQGSRPVDTILRYRGELEAALSSSQHLGKDGRALAEGWPRYARVNTLSSSLGEVGRQLVEEGWEQQEFQQHITSQQYLELLRGLRGKMYLQDLHIPSLLVFPPKTELALHPLVKQGQLVLQDKASCLPVHCLDPPQGSRVLDTCSAPGMKTSQLAAAVGHAGGVVAVERSSARCSTLRKVLKTTGCDGVVTVYNQDFLRLQPHLLKGLEMAVVDPSCSGTGMARREGHQQEVSKDRLLKLQELQVNILTKVLSIESMVRVVYSTCATSVTENEEVVERVLQTFPGWGIKEGVLPTWPRRGFQGASPLSQHMIRAEAEEDLCNGFFVAVFEKKDSKD